MAPPLFVLGAMFLAKKAVAVVLFRLGTKYGWSRVYRRLLELNKQTTPTASQKHVRKAIASGFRLPQLIAGLLKDPEIKVLISAAAESGLAKSITLFPGITLSSLLRALQVFPDGLVKNLVQSVADEKSKGEKPLR